MGMNSLSATDYALPSLLRHMSLLLPPMAGMPTTGYVEFAMLPGLAIYRGTRGTNSTSRSSPICPLGIPEAGPFRR